MSLLEDMSNKAVTNSLIVGDNYQVQGYINRKLTVSPAKTPDRKDSFIKLEEPIFFEYMGKYYKYIVGVLTVASGVMCTCKSINPVVLEVSEKPCVHFLLFDDTVDKIHQTMIAFKNMFGLDITADLANMFVGLLYDQFKMVGEKEVKESVVRNALDRIIGSQNGIHYYKTFLECLLGFERARCLISLSMFRELRIDYELSKATNDIVIKVGDDELLDTIIKISKEGCKNPME